MRAIFGPGAQNIRRQFNNRKSAAVGWRACARGRGHHARAGVKFVSRKVAKAQSLKFSQKSQPRHSVGQVCLVSNVAKRFGPVCGGVFAANQPQFAAKFAKVWRGKFRSGRRRKSAALSLLSGQVSLGGGRDAKGRSLESQVASGCHRVVAPGPGFTPPLG